MEEIQDFIEKIKRTDKAIIVEGKKDKAALEFFGATNIYCLNKPIYQVIEDVALRHKGIVILTDLDNEGKKLYGKLSSGLQRYGCKIDHFFREFLFKNTKLRQIEGLVNYVKKEKIKQLLPFP